MSKPTLIKISAEGARLPADANELESALASAPPSAVPVAWATEDKEYFSTRSAADRHVAVWGLQQSPTPLYLAPPSAPAGVEDGPIDASDNAEYIEHCADRLERCGLRATAGALRVIAHEHRSLAQQPAAGEEIMVNAAHDVYTLPLQPSGLLSGPRFVVHVPAPEQPPAAPSGEVVAWLRMKPDGTPDWAEDCIGSDDKFLDPEMASDGYYLQPLYAAPQQPAGVDVDEVRRVAQHIGTAADYIDKAYPAANMLDRGPILRNMRRWHARLTAALAELEAVGCGACTGSMAPMEDLHARLADYLAGKPAPAAPSAPAGVDWPTIVEGLRLADHFFDGDDHYWQPASKVRAAYRAALAAQQRGGA